MKQFYIYIYRNLQGLPIYVGKGSGNRWRHHYKKPKKHTRISGTLRKIQLQYGISLLPQIIYAPDEEAAFLIEQLVIEKYGREDKGTGTLFNLNDGGLGGSAGRITSKDTREKMRRAITGKKHSEETKRKLSAIHIGKPKPKTAEHIRKISEAQKGRKLTEEHKMKLKIAFDNRSEEINRKRSQKISQTKRNNQRNIICTYCGKNGDQFAMQRWHFDNCKSKI